MTGYKASYNGKCKILTYEVGKTYAFNGTLKMCSQGFHFCKELKNVFNYYDRNNNLVVFEVEALGEVINENDKSVTDKIKIIRIIDKKEYQEFLPIKEYDKNAKVIIVSADIQKLSMDRVLALGAFNFIKKPIDIVKMQQIFKKLDELEHDGI